MSSITKDKATGLRRLEIIVGGKRHRIRLGRMSLVDIIAIQSRVDALDQANRGHRRDPEAEAWFNSRFPEVRKKLVAIGLLPARDHATLKGLIERFNASRSHVKSSTVAADKQATDSLLAFFGESRDPRTITTAEGQEWRNSMKYAEATIAKRIIKARSVFACGVRWGVVDRNPLAEVRSGSQENKARIFFVDDATSRTVLDICPNAEWRGIFALSRWGGLRIPSELALLNWSDIHWDKKKFRVTSPKTAHHKGGDERWMVLLPQVEKALLELHGFAPVGVDRIFPARLTGRTNLRTTLTKIVKRAGVTVWPKLFHNLRGSLQTELTMTHPLHVVCNWIGNSAKVAEAHYLSVPDSVFIHAAQNAAQQASAVAGSSGQNTIENAEKGLADSDSVWINGRYRANSLRSFLRELFISHGCGAKSGALESAIIAYLSLSPAAEGK